MVTLRIYTYELEYSLQMVQDFLIRHKKKRCRMNADIKLDLSCLNLQYYSLVCYIYILVDESVENIRKYRRKK